MNEFVSSRYVESFQHLALGVEPRDALRRGRVSHPLDVRFEAVKRTGRIPMEDVLRPIDRHDSCRHALLYRPGLRTGKPIEVRIRDASRRFVPRRLSVTLPTLEAAEAAEAVDATVRVQRLRFVSLLPGAAYDFSDSAAGMRGRVVRNGVPMRWARVEAALPAPPNTVVARAHGDDRGEFLLLLSPAAATAGDLPPLISLRVTVYGPNVAPPPPDPDVDPLSDLPLEPLPSPDVNDPVALGEALPPDYVSKPATVRMVNFPPGRVITGQPSVTQFDFT
jgi:hypothetical protein